VIPVIALLALELGASPAGAGFIVALNGIGTMAFDIPSGILVGRLGEKRAMVYATAALGVIALAVALRPHLVVYAGLVLVMGCSWSVWALARLAYATETAPARHRGRVMSMMGGTVRIGQFVGPLIGGLLVIPLGLVGPFLFQAVLAVAAAVILGSTPDLAPARSGPAGPIKVKEILRAHRHTFATAGVVAIALQVLRSARQAIIPLWGDHLGLSASQISLIFGVSSGIEMVIFYPMGMLMDRKGRRWVAIPCLLLLSAGMALVPLTDDFAGLLLVGAFLGVANGIGSGVNMTLGSDLSPVVGRSQFLGVWRLVSDIGTAGGPLLVAAVTSLASLAAAPVAVALVGLLGTGVMWWAVPETLTADLE
jgi:MFS family permease